MNYSIKLNLPCGAKDYFVYDIVSYECILNALEIIVSFKDVRVINIRINKKYFCTI